jgi:hypothetical protein
MDISIIKRQTAYNLIVGPLVDPTNGVSPVTGITSMTGFDEASMIHISSSDVDISSNSITAVDATNMPGYYYVAMQAGDFCREGLCAIALQDASLFLPYRQLYNVVHERSYEPFFSPATTRYLQCNVTQINAATALGAGSTADTWD